MLLLELARTPADFDTQVDGRRDETRTSLYVDFAFIAAYWLVFATTSALFATRGFWGAAWLGAVAGELATVGALADVSENTHALRLLEGEWTADRPRDAVVKAMRLSSLLKWSSLFAAAALLSIMFFERGGLNVLLGFAYVLAAAAGIATVAAEAFKVNIPPARLEPILRAAFFTMGLAIAVGLPVAASQL